LDVIVTINRRTFLNGLGVTGFALREWSADAQVFSVRRLRRYTGSGLSLPAVAAACMPESLVIEPSGNGAPMRGNVSALERLARAGYVELRRYRQDGAVGLQETLLSHGIPPLLTGENGAFLFAFDTLANREKSWRELSSQREWLELEGKLEELAIYQMPDGHSKTT
jgi:hypothetical protein